MEQRLSRFLRQRLAAGDDGKTFLIGWHGDGALFALAAGLRAGLIGDLDRAGGALPGRLRRDLDRLYAVLQLIPPD